MAPNGFEGITGRVTAKVMARMNRASEEEAAELLAPAPGDRVLALGIGAGIGVGLLAERVPDGRVTGVDPSPAMLAEAAHRNRRWIEVGTVGLVRASADRLPDPDASFDGAVAVNCIQLWQPLDASLREVSRVLVPGARLVTLTHEWALVRSAGGDLDVWTARIRSLCERCGFTDPRVWRGRAEKGTSVAFEVTRGTQESKVKKQSWVA